MAASPFQINGLGSGVDTASILDTLRAYRMRPATLEQNKQAAYSAKKQAWMDLNVRLLAVQNAAQALGSASAFASLKAASSDETVAMVTASGSAASGAASLSVTQLAQARKVVSGSVTGIANSGAALGWTGDFSVNGKFVAVTAEDSLDTIAGKINALGVGANAAVVQTTPGEYKMTLGGSATGRQDALSLADLSGGDTLSARLGILSGTSELRYATGGTGNVAGSLAFSATSATATLGGLTGLPATTGTFTIGTGPAVSYDTASDTLATLAQKITTVGAGAGFSAAVVTAPDGQTQRLQISGVAASDFGADAAGLMNALGIVQKQIAPGRELVAAQDAVFTLDGNLQITRPTNTISDALSGVTLNLKKGGGATSQLTFAKDTQATTDLVSNFVKAYNDVAGKIRAQSAFTVGGGTPPLLGDFTLQRVQEDLAGTLTATVSGQPAGFGNLRDVGIRLNDDGTLSLNAAALSGALAKNSAAVSRLFTQFGTADDPAVTYLSATGDTKASPAGGGTGYEVAITQAATRAQVSASEAAAANSFGAEVLTFSGALFASGAKTVTLAAGNTLAQSIAQINAGDVGKLLTAFDDGGKLGLRSLEYGAAQSFSVVSDKANAPGETYSGVGTSARTAAGGDVSGTINGETATGRGRTLSGSQTGGAANGLALLVSASAPGSYGRVSVQRGAAALAVKTLAGLTDVFTGTIQQEEDALDSRIADSQKSVAAITARVDAYIEIMQRQFTRMETQISRFKSQSSQLSQTIAGLNKSNNNN